MAQTVAQAPRRPRIEPRAVMPYRARGGWVSCSGQPLRLCHSHHGLADRAASTSGGAATIDERSRIGIRQDRAAGLEGRPQERRGAAAGGIHEGQHVQGRHG